jgi:hypothetical protein
VHTKRQKRQKDSSNVLELEMYGLVERRRWSVGKSQQKIFINVSEFCNKSVRWGGGGGVGASFPNVELLGLVHFKQLVKGPPSL